MKDKQDYLCGVNLLWADPLLSVTPAVPLIAGAILEIAETMFPNGPAGLVDHVLTLKSGPLNKGAALRVSPEEPQHAVIFKIAARIDEEAEEAELLEWKRVLLSFPGKFIHLDTDDDVYFHVTNAREKVKSAAAAISHKTSQIIFDIHGYRVKKESELGPLTPAAIAQFYQDC